MTNEEALNVCRMALKCIGNRHSECCSEEWIATISEHYDLELMLEALEKQIPRKPIEEQNLMTCPVCGCQEIQYVDWFGIRKMNYCPCCSQAIDWSKE